MLNNISYSTTVTGLDQMIHYLEASDKSASPLCDKLRAVRQLADELKKDGLREHLEFLMYSLNHHSKVPEDKVSLSDDKWAHHINQAVTQMTQAYSLRCRIPQLSYHTRTLENDLKTWLSGAISIPLIERWLKDIQNADKSIQKEREEAMDSISKYSVQRTQSILPSTIITGDRIMADSEFEEKLLAQASNHLVVAEYLLRNELTLMKMVDRTPKKEVTADV